MKMILPVLAIARSESRFGLRRGSLVVIPAVVGLLIGAGTLVAPLVTLGDWASGMEMTAEKWDNWSSFGFTLEEYGIFRRAAFGDMFVFSTHLAWLMSLLFLVFLPIAAIGVIPADRRHGIDELIHSQPIDGWTYLTGKVLGAATVVLLVAGATLGLFFVVTETILLLRLGYGLSAGASLFLLKLSLLDGVPMLLWSTGLNVLAGVPFRSHKAAILPGMLLGALNLTGWVTLFRPPAQGLLGMTDIVYYRLVYSYTSPAMALEARAVGHAFDIFGLGSAPEIGIGRIALMYAALLAALLLLAGLARLWLKWKENF